MKKIILLLLVSVFSKHLYSQILYVDSSYAISGNGTSWSTAYKTLSEALDSAQKNEYITQIHVAKGTYNPTRYIYNMPWSKVGVEQTSLSSSYRTFHIRAGLKVYGGYPTGGGIRNVNLNKTILSGALPMGDTAYHTVFTDRPSSWGSTTSSDTTVIDGFTITNGKCVNNNPIYLSGLTVNPTIYSYRGGGIYINNGLCAVRNCIITKNSGQDGVAIYARNVTAVFENLDIKQNLSNYTFYGITFFGFNRGTGIYIDNSAYSLKNSTISNNNATIVESAGNAISSNECQFNIINNIFNNNHTVGHSLMDFNLCSGNFANNKIIGNTAYSTTAGLNIVAWPFINIYNNYFAENKYLGTTYSGSGCIYADGGTNNIFNNVFAYNYSKSHGAGFSCYQGTHTIVNNTFIGNRSDSSLFGGAAIYAYSANIHLYNNIFNKNNISGDTLARYSDIYDLVNTTFIVKDNLLQLDSNSTNYPTGTYGTGINKNMYAQNPKFKGGTQYDSLSLATGSPAINIGDSTKYTWPPKQDMFGNKRIVGQNIDAGALEGIYCKSYSSISQSIIQGDSFFFNNLYLKVSGVYIDTLVNSSNCDSILTLSLTVIAPPNCANYKTISFISNSNQSFNFYCNGIIPSPFSATYFWQFSNGTSSIIKNPIVNTMNSGYKWAKLKVCIKDSLQNIICCDSSFLDSICNLTYNLTAISPICNNDSNGHIILTIKGGTPVYKYLWSNGSALNYSSNLKSGIYSVTMSDINNCSISSSINLLNPSALSINSVKTSNSITTSMNGGHPPYLYNWSNGSNSSSLNGLNSGIYCLTVTDSNGCEAYKCDTIGSIINNPCNFSKQIFSSTSGQTVNFSSNIPTNYNSTQNWTFGLDTTQSTSANPSYTYTTSGSFIAKLKFCLLDSTMNVICCDSMTKTITIAPTCNINSKFGWTSTANSGTYQFIDSTTPIGTYYTYLWNFGDSTYSSVKNPIKSYTSNGTKTVCLIITKYSNISNQICRDTVCKTINVTNVNTCNRFIPNFTWSSVSGSYQINNLTNLYKFKINSISYSFSTGNSYSTLNPSHTFTKNGNYSITLTMSVYDSISGTICTKTLTKPIIVNTSICGCLKAYNLYTKTGMTVHFSNQSFCADTSTTYLYKFGNGATSILKNPSYTYSLPGLYRITMIVSKTVGSFNCIDSFIRFIQITTTNPCKDSGYLSSQICQSYISPVCGCDSVTYMNYCFASKVGVKQYSYGPCANDTTYVKICGNVYNDFNKNCVFDITDGKLANIPIKINSSPIRYTYTNSQGYYTIYLPKGTYQLTQILTGTTFPRYQICPASNGSITVAATVGGMTYCNNNFYDTSNTCPDIATSIHRVANITPGFTSMKSIKYQNNGAIPISGVVLKYRFLSSLTVNSSTTASYTVSGNVITWNLGTLAPYSTGYKSAHFTTPTTLSLGTTVIDSVWIEPMTGDCNLSNNSATYSDTCVGSWDPNDKSAHPANDITPEVKQIDYIVRFQNTGSSPAQNVLIEDQINSNFERNSLSVKSSSHAMTHHYDDAGKLFFEFANIMLPDSGTDYNASQGYVAYSLKLKDGLSVGTQLKNTAHIFFDFNEAVITNTTVNTIVLKSTTGVQNQGKDMNISIFPNPTADRATIFIKLDKASQVSYSLYDLQGKVIFQNGTDKSHTGEFNQDLSLEGLTKGIYLLNITVNGKESSFKLVKE